MPALPVLEVNCTGLDMKGDNQHITCLIEKFDELSSTLADTFFTHMGSTNISLYIAVTTNGIVTENFIESFDDYHLSDGFLRYPFL